ncbi:MAG TPA: methyl-accepting chemotaxis protein, partial [bacterium]|nr:methyl-accepting chemotaxis protein [bacterium]
MQSKMSIKAKLALLLIALIAGVIVIVAITVFSSYSNRLDSQLKESSAAKIDAAAMTIDSWYALLAQNIKTLRIETAGRSGGYEELRQSFLAGVQDNPDILSIYFGTVRKNSDGGAFIESGGWKPPAGWEQSTRGWFIASMATKNVVLTPPYVDSNTGKLVVTVSGRVDDKKGVTLGVAGLDVLLTTVETTTKALKLTKNGRSYLLDGAGLFITAENEKDVLAKNYFESKGRQDLQTQLKSQDFAFVLDKGGHSYCAARTMGRTGWILVSEGPLADVYGSLYAFIAMLMIVGLAALILGGIIVVFVASSFTKPILVMNAVALGLAAGNLKVALDRRVAARGDEIGTLASSLYKTIEKLVEVVSEVQMTASQVSSGANEMSVAAQQMAAGISGIADSSQQLSQGATEQAASAEEVSASVEQMSANIRQNADNSYQTEKISAKAAGDAKEGLAAVRETVVAMRQ